MTNAWIICARQLEEKVRFTRKKLNAVVPYILIITGFFLIYSMLLSGRARSKQTNSYIRVTACIISKNAKDRSQADIEDCYQKVDADTNVHLIRYDK